MTQKPDKDAVAWSPAAQALLEKEKETEEARRNLSPRKNPDADSQPRPSARKEAHGSIKNYHVLGQQSLKQIFPGLHKGPEKQGLVIIGLMIFTGLVGAFTGVYIAGNYINPPVQIIGVCAPPAHFITEGGVFGVGASQVCVTSQTVAQGSTEVVINTPAGQYYLVNGTRYTP